MIDYFNIIIDSIFDGTSIVVPCLLVVFIFKIKLPIISQSTLIQAVNLSLLLGSLFFVSGIITQIFIELFSKSEFAKYETLNRLFGPYWWAFWLFISPAYLLPQILWVRKFRNTIISSLIISGIRFLLLLFMLTKVYATSPFLYLKAEFTSIDCLKQAVIYIIILSGMYFVLSKRSVPSVV